jgi:hypothetical protein
MSLSELGEATLDLVVRGSYEFMVHVGPPRSGSELLVERSNARRLARSRS